MKSKAYVTAYNKKYYARNKARLNARNKEWYIANPERVIAAGKLSYARIHADPGARARYLIRAARARAKLKGLPFDILVNDILWQIELGVCAVTGIPFHFAANEGRHPFTPSIDRVDNDLGYVKGNVRVVVWALNAMRGDWGDAVLLQVADALKRTA